ncbi:hypothetical protein AM571_PC01581 (plasmid) [Rhizobium etli 8C-3]|uniref:Uncharacterized protein n=1 Tax=Rhizobium etli 8C-3 TaxID=538025 RepID=A0A1L5PGT3_RHIET|nr:hypothetical protein AM571_PC01581 [Rhizobium etli 8C-3]
MSNFPIPVMYGGQCGSVVTISAQTVLSGPQAASPIDERRSCVGFRTVGSLQAMMI